MKQKIETNKQYVKGQKVFIALTSIEDIPNSLQNAIQNGYCGRLTVTGNFTETDAIELTNSEGRCIALFPEHLWLSNEKRFKKR